MEDKKLMSTYLFKFLSNVRWKKTFKTLLAALQPKYVLSTSKLPKNV